MYATYDGGQSWSEQQELVAFDEAAGDEFGCAIALYNDMVVVGAYLDDNERGTNAGEK